MKTERKQTGEKQGRGAKAEFPQQSLDLVQNRLNKMTEVTRFVTASLETATVVRNIIEAIPQLIPSVEACVLLMYEPGKERLVARDYVGFVPEIINKLQLAPGESMSGYSFLHNRPVRFAGDQIIRDGLATMSPPNRSLQLSLTPVQAKSIMCAPLEFKGRVLGVITVNNFTSTSAFTDFDLQLLQSLASQASIAIENSRLYEEQSASLHKMEQLNQIITRQHQQLEKALYIHRTLSGLALQNLGLSAITQALANILGQAVTVTDLLFNTMVQAQPDKLPPEEQEPPLPSPKHSSAPAQGKSQLQNLPGDQNSPILFDNSKKAYPIQAGDDKLGFILTSAEQDSSYGDFAEVAIEQAATIIALEMVKEHAIFEVERRLRGEFLEELLNGKYDEYLGQRASFLGYDSNCLYWIILADIDDFRGFIQKNNLEEDQIATFKRRLLKFISAFVTRSYPKSIITVRSDMLVILLGIPRTVAASKSYERALKITQEIECQLAQEFSQISFTVGLSRACNFLSEFKTRYEEVAMALQMRSNIPGLRGLVDCSRLGSALLLLKLPDQKDLVDLAENVLGKLVKYDRQHHSNLIETLIVYSQCNSDSLQSASKLHVHHNTMLYRLKRIEEILGRKLSNTEDWLDIQIALRLIQAYPSLVNIIN